MTGQVRQVKKQTLKLNPELNDLETARNRQGSETSILSTMLKTRFSRNIPTTLLMLLYLNDPPTFVPHTVCKFSRSRKYCLSTACAGCCAATKIGPYVYIYVWIATKINVRNRVNIVVLIWDFFFRIFNADLTTCVRQSNRHLS